MQRLSSTSTWFYKRMFPAVWFGFIALFFAFSLWARLHPEISRGPPPDLMFMVMPLFMAVVGFIVFRQLIFDLVDEVWLDGDWLLVTNHGEKQRVALADVMNINSSTRTNPRRVTVMLRTKTRLGSSFSFVPASPRGFLSAFKPDPVATDLIRRVDAARQAAR